MMADPVFWTVIGAMGLACFLSFQLGREVEGSRPTASGDWSDADCGDFPSISDLFHNGTDRR